MAVKAIDRFVYIIVKRGKQDGKYTCQCIFVDAKLKTMVFFANLYVDVFNLVICSLSLKLSKNFCWKPWKMLIVLVFLHFKTRKGFNTKKLGNNVLFYAIFRGASIRDDEESARLRSLSEAFRTVFRISLSMNYTIDNLNNYTTIAECRLGWHNWKDGIVTVSLNARSLKFYANQCNFCRKAYLSDQAAKENDALTEEDRNKVQGGVLILYYFEWLKVSFGSSHVW